MAKNWCANQKYYLSFSSFTCFIPYIILFCSNGLDKKKSKYMRLTIDINYKNCLYLRKKSKKERWKVICSRGDPECYGSNECNAIECKNPDKMKKLDLGTKSYKHIWKRTYCWSKAAHKIVSLPTRPVVIKNGLSDLQVL